MALRTGHLHHTEIFNERISDLLQNNVVDEEESLFRLKEAMANVKLI